MSITPEVSAKTLSQRVATQIKVQLVLADMRQSDLARRIGKNEQWLSVRLRGIQPIDMNDLALIASALGVSVADLVQRAENGAKEHLPDINHSTDPGRVSAPYSRHTASAPGPMSPQRRDATRPQSSVPATKRRPTTLRSPSRPMAA